MFIFSWPTRIFILKLLLTMPPSLVAAEHGVPQPGDFGYGVHMQSENDSAIQYAQLTYPIYKKLVRSDLGDIRVFNEQSQSMPFILKKYNASGKDTIKVSVPFFPVSVGADKKLKNVELKVTQAVDGALIDLKTVNGFGKDDESIGAYILDMASSKQPEKFRLSELRFGWEQLKDDFIGEISLDVSDDLDRWSTLVEKATLSRISYNGNILKKDTLAIPYTDSRYIRISWPPKQKTIDLKRVDAIFTRHRDVVATQWHELDLSKVDGKRNERPTEVSYVFNTEGPLPLSAIEFVFPNDNSFFQGVLYSRNGSNEEWAKRGRFLQYQLKLPAGLLRSDAHKISHVRDKYWMLTFEGGSELSEMQLPKIRVGWHTEWLVFLARSKSVYTLAYGSASVLPAVHSISRLIAMVPEADWFQNAPMVLGKPFELGGEARLKPALSFPWRKLILWLVLLLGVVVMGWMAKSLFKQMQAD